MKTMTKPESELAKAAAQALKRAAKRARAIARQHGTPIHVQSNGTVVALKPWDLPHACRRTDSHSAG